VVLGVPPRRRPRSSPATCRPCRLGVGPMEGDRTSSRCAVRAVDAEPATRRARDGREGSSDPPRRGAPRPARCGRRLMRETSSGSSPRRRMMTGRPIVVHRVQRLMRRAPVAHHALGWPWPAPGAPGRLRPASVPRATSPSSAIQECGPPPAGRRASLRAIDGPGLLAVMPTRIQCHDMQEGMSECTPMTDRADQARQRIVESSMRAATCCPGASSSAARAAARPTAASR